MSTRANAVNRLFDEVVNEWNFTELEQVFAPTFQADESHFPSVCGPENARQFFNWLRSVFPDVHYTVDDMVVEGDKVAVRAHATATQHGEYLGHPPTGLPVEYTEMFIFHLLDGKIAEWWIEADRRLILQQIGVGPTAS